MGVGGDREMRLLHILTIILISMIIVGIWIPWIDIRVLATYIAVWFILFCLFMKEVMETI